VVNFPKNVIKKGHCLDEKCLNKKCRKIAALVSSDAGQALMCLEDQDCPMGYYCAALHCAVKLENGYACIRNEMCEEGYCDETCGSCLTHEHCNKDQRCKRAYSKDKGNRCAPRKRNGQSCKENEECKSSHCFDGRCRVCSTDDVCPPGFYCEINDLKEGDNICRRKEELRSKCTV
ncbi:unnamed protein product, partial [Owenia fusiformis]